MKMAFYLLLTSFLVFTSPAFAEDNDNTGFATLDENSPNLAEPPSPANPNPTNNPNIENQQPASGAIQVDEGGAPAKKVIESVPANDNELSAGDAKAESKKQAKKTTATPKADGKGKFMTTRSECQMYKEQNAGAAIVATLSQGKKIWTEPSDANWVQVFRSHGEVAYLKKSCLK